MRIGILSFWGVPNHGTYAQMFALRNYLQSVDTDNEVVLIGYLHKKHVEFYEEYRNKCDNIKKRKASDDLFIKKYMELPHVDVKSVHQLEKEKFDVVVLGSDIIWDYSIDVFGDDVHLFGNRINANRVISYATSFGTCKLNRTPPDYVVNGLKGLSGISVRDDNSAEIVKSIIGVKPPVVLDPIWLWDFFVEFDDKKKDIEREPFVFLYGENFDDCFLKEVRAFVRERGLKTVALNAFSDEFSWCDKEITSYEEDPMSVLSYFRYADYVVTNTFHGMMFGLYFRKRIAYSKSEFVWSKLKSLMKDLGIYELFHEGKTVKEMFEYDWESIELKRKLDYRISQSKSYIESNLLISE